MWLILKYVYVLLMCSLSAHIFLLQFTLLEPTELNLCLHFAHVFLLELSHA